MVVQFKCPGCGQPVEVDDEWSGKQVGCPFCERLISAPAQSTFSPRACGVPLARKVVGVTSASGRVAGYNRLGACGLASALIAIFFYLLGGILMASFVYDTFGAQPDPAELTPNRLWDFFVEQGVPHKVLLASLSFLLCVFLWFVGTVVSGVAVARTHLRGRRVAAAGLCCSGILPLMVCAGMVLNAGA